MAKVQLGTEFVRYGRIGGALIFRTWKGIQVVAKKGRYVYRNSPEQQKNRTKFADAVHTWQTLDIITQYLWRAAAYGTYMSGYEYFIKKYMEDRP